MFHNFRVKTKKAIKKKTIFVALLHLKLFFIEFDYKNNIYLLAVFLNDVNPLSLFKREII